MKDILKGFTAEELAAKEEQGEPLIEETPTPNRLKIQAVNVDKNPFPPYDIWDDSDDAAVLVFAVAGYPQRSLRIELQGSILTLSGIDCSVQSRIPPRKRGIKFGAFARVFELGDDVNVCRTELNDGILIIYLERRLIPKDSVLIPIIGVR